MELAGWTQEGTLNVEFNCRLSTHPALLRCAVCVCARARAGLNPTAGADNETPGSPTVVAAGEAIASDDAVATCDEPAFPPATASASVDVPASAAEVDAGRNQDEEETVANCAGGDDFD